MNPQNFATVYPTPEQLPPVVINDPSRPLISIVTPSYNQGAYIRETIDSVLNQDYPNIEYWVIDGGSTDETISILQQYQHDERFHWISEPDQGQSDAINKGLARCQGEIFSWLNSDDTLVDGALAHIVAVWTANQEPVIIYGPARFIDQRGNDIGYCPGFVPGMNLEKLLRFGRYYLAQPATFAPAAMCRQVGGIDNSLHYAMDLDLWIRLAEHVPMRWTLSDLACYRIHPTSKTVTLSIKFIDEVAEVLRRSASRGLLSTRQARSRAQLYAARTYLLPEHRAVRLAMNSMAGATVEDVSSLPEAMLILIKAVIRLIVGEQLWSKARLIQARLH